MTAQDETFFTGYMITNGQTDVNGEIFVNY